MGGGPGGEGGRGGGIKNRGRCVRVCVCGWGGGGVFQRAWSYLEAAEHLLLVNKAGQPPHHPPVSLVGRGGGVKLAWPGRETVGNSSG